jgi:hypothetical protein
MIKITVGRSRQLKRPEADLIKSFVIDAEGLIGVFDELMNREGGVVWFDYGIRDFWRRHDGECAHHSIGIFFANLGDDKGTHTSTSSATKRVSNLET